MELTTAEEDMLAGADGPGTRMAMEIVVQAGQMLGATRLVEIKSSHIDGCLYHGIAGVLFCERLAEGGARVRVPTTTNVGALNLLKPDQCRLDPQERKLAYRQMLAHETMGCAPSWTCAPYQAGARPEFRDQVAWGESNAVAFANSVLGARTNRYGDFLDIACAVTGRAPYCGLHCPENRVAELVLDVSELSFADPSDYAVLGALAGHKAGSRVCAITGLPQDLAEDELKSLCAAAASTGAVGLIHLVGLTPEAPTLAAVAGAAPTHVSVSAKMMGEARRQLSLAKDGPIDSVALGSPHFSADECRALFALADNTPFQVPVYVCTGRHSYTALQEEGLVEKLERLGVVFVVDTCVVVTPILPAKPGVMMTNSAKFAHYATGNTGHIPVFGPLRDCVASAQVGEVVRLGGAA